MEDKKSDIDKTRRNVLRSAASLSSLGATALFATGTGTAQSTQSGDYGYEINENGYLEYHGDRNKGYIQQTVEALNEAKEKGQIGFALKNGKIVTQPQQTVSTDGLPTPECKGVNGFDVNNQWNGTKYSVKFDYCLTIDIVDAMIAGAAAAQVTALITAHLGAIPVAVASECAVFIIGAGWQILSHNNNGRGVEIVVFMPSRGGLPGVNPQ